MISLPPGIIILVGALALPLLPRSAQAIGALALPAISLAQLLFLSEGVFPGIELAGLSLLQVRVDPLSLAFGYIFHIAAFIVALYALHVRDTVQHVTAMLYVGSAIGAVFAGDLITLFIYWEITALASVFLIFASRTQRAYQAGIRYLIVQIGSGVLLLAGILLHYHDSGSLSFDQLIGPDGNLSDASAGVWLIFAAFGIIFAHRNLSHVLAARETDELTRWNRLGRRLLSLLVLNMAAWCVTTPLCLAHFGTSSPAGLIVNAGFLPLASLVVIPLSFVYAGMCRFLPSLADFLQPAIDGVIGAFLDGVDGWFEMVPSSQTSTIGHWEGIAVALAVLGVLHRPTRRRMLLLALCVFHSLSQAPGDTSPLRISMFDVGHGDAALIQTPEGGTMLVDSGGSGRSTARNSHLADRIVVPSMARLGASRIDVAVVTHPHADHMGALERIAERFRIGALWIGPCGHEDPLMRRLASRVRSQGGSVHVVTRGHQDTWAGIQLRVLWPPPDVLRPNGSCRYGLNDASVVLQVTYAGRRVLMVGDLERKGEEGLLALEPNLESTLLKVGHHGSKTSTSTRFLDSVNPAYSVISGTLRPGRFPPHSDIIRRLHEGNILTWITGRDGAVTFDIDQEGHVVPFGYPSGRTLRVP